MIEKSTRSSFELYSQVLEANQFQPRVMSTIDNEEKILAFAFLDPKEGSSKEAQEYKVAHVKIILD